MKGSTLLVVTTEIQWEMIEKGTTLLSPMSETRHLLTFPWRPRQRGQQRQLLLSALSALSSSAFEPSLLYSMRNHVQGRKIKYNANISS